MASKEPHLRLMKKQLIDQLVSITGSSKVVASNILEACNDDLQLAVSMLVDQPVESSTSGSRSYQPGNDDDDVRPPIPPTQEILLPENNIPFRLQNKRKVRSVFDGFRDFQAEARQQEAMLLSKNSPCCSPSKKRTLEELFRPPLDILFAGNFQMARDASISANKWLLVNVQNAQEFTCQALNRDLWSNSIVKGIIKDHFVFWQVYHDSEDGDKYMMFYNVTEWPYISVLDPRTGECLMFWNKIDTTCFCDLITEFVLKNPAPDNSLTNLQCLPATSKKVVKHEMPSSVASELTNIIDANEESQLEAAIKASLEQCKREVSSSDSELEGFDSDEEVPGPSRSPEALSDSKPPRSPNSTQQLISESWKDYKGTNSELALRYPDGSKESLSLPCSSKIQAIRLFVNGKGYSSDVYELLTNFPTRKLSSVDPLSTLQDNGLHPQQTIFIQLK